MNTQWIKNMGTAAGWLAGLGLVFTGCSSKSGPDAGGDTGGGKKLTVGFSQIGAESDWRVAETASIKEEAEKRGVDLKFSDAQGKKENQIRAIRSFIAQGVDAIILAPKEETGWDSVLKEAKTAGIPVVLVDRGIKVEDESLYATLIASDFVYEGRLAGEWLARKTEGKAKIIELQGSPGAAPAIDRQKGFMEVINQHEGMEVIASQTGNFEQEKGQEVMDALLQQHGDVVTAVYAHNDNMALGAIQAIKQAGKKPGEGIVIVSIDAVKSAFEAMARGELNCTVECSPLLGAMAFDAVDSLVAGQTLEKKQVVQDQVFDQSQATPDVVAGRKY